MNETTPPATDAPKGGSVKFILPIILVILVIGLVGFFITVKPGIDDKQIKVTVHEWVESYNSLDNRELSLENIEINKSGVVPYLVLHKPRLFLKQLELAGDEEKADLVITTPKLEIHPQSLQMNQFKVVLSESILFRKDAEDIARVSFAQPWEVSVEETVEEEQAIYHFHSTLPNVTTIDSLQDSEAFRLSLTEGSKVTGSRALDPLQRLDALLTLNAMTLESIGQQKGSLSVASIKVDAGLRNMNKDSGAVRANILIDDMFSNEEDMPYGALSLALNADYSGPSLQHDRVIDWAAETALVDVKQLNLQTEKFVIDSQLKFQTGTGELLPVGAGKLHIQNFAFIREELEKNEIITEDDNVLCNALARKVVGTAFNDIQDLQLSIRRESGQSLRIGQSSFEELFAIFLTGGKFIPKNPHDSPPVSSDEHSSNDESKPAVEAEE